MTIDKADFLNLSLTQHRRTVKVQSTLWAATTSQLLEEFRLLALASGYHEESWRQAIIDAASLYKDSSEKKDNSEKNETPFPDAELVLDGVIKYRDVTGEYRALRERLSLTPDDCRRIVDVARRAE